MSIEMESNKVSFFPGEIMSGTISLFPFIQSFEKILDNPSLTITIAELKYYSLSTGTGKHRRTISKREENNLTSTIIDFSNYITQDYSTGYKVPFSLQIPNNAYPSIQFTDKSAYVKHYIIVELPHVNAKRAKMLIVKNTLPNDLNNSLLKNMIEQNKEYKKSKLFFEKGSCSLNVKMPKNYFFYNEKIPFEFNLDYSNLKMEIKSIKVSLTRKRRKNNDKDYTKIQGHYTIILSEKNYNLEKGLSNFHISDFLEFPVSSDYNSVYPPNVYASFDQYGLLELNDSKFQYELYPSAYNGLVSVDYLVDFKIYFDSSLTFDEEFEIPIYFCPNYENNYNTEPMTNQGYSSSIPYTSSNVYNNNNYANSNFTPQ